MGFSTFAGSKVPDSKKKGAPSYSFGHKLINRDETTGPGPAQYNVAGMRPKGKDHARAATLQSRPKELTSFVNPGPGEYDVLPASKAVIDATPKYTFGRKPASAKYQLIPGKSRRSSFEPCSQSFVLGCFGVPVGCLNGCWSLVAICMRIINANGLRRGIIIKHPASARHQPCLAQTRRIHHALCIYIRNHFE